jgi:hypothetical protein
MRRRISITMKRLLTAALIAFPVALFTLALSASAQRGGGHGGGSAGHSGSFSGHSGSFTSRSASAFSSPGRTSFAPAPRPSVSSYSAPSSANFRRPPTPEPVFNNRRGNGNVYRYRLPYIPTYGLGLSYGPAFYGSTWYGPDCIGFAYCGYDDSAYDNSAYAAPPPPDYYPPDQYQPPPTEQAVATPPPDAFRPTYQRPQPEPAPEDPVTLIFKDGRPSQQIHNYILTRTTLYVLDAKRTVIPIDQLDLAATVKVNSDAGDAFQLPQALK